MMKSNNLLKIFVLIFAILLGSCVASDLQYHLQDRQKIYILGSDDIPLFTGLTLIEDDSSDFDSVLGSISISKYSGNVTVKDVQDFYIKTLPQMGWMLTKIKGSDLSFSREKDRLEIKFSSENSALIVRFFISYIS